MVIGDFIYELQFAIEESLTGEPHLVDMDSINEDDPKSEDPNKGEKPNGGTSTENMDVDGKSLESHVPGNGSGAVPPSATQHGAPQGVSQLQGSGDPSANSLKKPKPVLTQIGGCSIDDGTWTTTLLPPQNDSGTIIKKFSSETSSPERSSKRNAATVDMDSTEKAAKLKAKKNLDSSIGKGNTQQTLSFVSRDDSSILCSSSSLGVVLGSNDQDVLSSLKRLKDLEHKRMLEVAGLRDENCVLAEDDSTGCSTEDNLDLEALNFICTV